MSFAKPSINYLTYLGLNHLNCQGNFKLKDKPTTTA